MNKLMELHPRGAVVVCEHVAELRYPILRGKRDEPDFPEDTGWQFLCNRHSPERRPLFWALEEVIAYEPSLADFADCPPGTELVRPGQGEDWIVTGC